MDCSLKKTAGKKFEGFTDVDDEGMWNILLRVNILLQDW